MSELFRIKDHVDAHGVGCAVVKDHVAISVLWKTKTLSGEEQRLETTRRVTSFKEACCAIGCRCCQEKDATTA